MFLKLRLMLLISALLFSHQASAQWKKIYTSYTNDLFGLHQVQGRAYACGQGSTVLKSNDSGKSWSKLTLTIPTNLKAIYFWDTLTGIVTGENARIQKTINGGKTWTQKYVRTAAFAFDMKFSGNTGIAVGKDLLAVSSNDAGETWTVDTTPLVRKQLNCVSISPGGYCWTVGDSGFAFKKHVSEKKWQQVYLGTKINLTTVNTIGDSTIIIAGGMQDTANVGKHFNILYYSTDSGKSWLSTPVNEMKTIYASHFQDGDTGFLCGTNGIISKSYQPLSKRGMQLSGTATALNRIHFLGNNGLIIGDGGLILRTTNRGGRGLSISILPKIQFQTYPNPSNGEFKISCQETIQKIWVTNSLGQSVPFSFNNGTLKLEDATSGQYFLKIETVSGSLLQTTISVFQ